MGVFSIPSMPLSETAIRNAKPKEKPYKIADEKGMYLLVHPNGSKYFRLKYRFDGKERAPLALGVYPDTPLKTAREKRDEVREMLANSIDLGEHRKAVKQAKIESTTNSFEIVAREWHSKFKAKWTPDHASRLLTRLEKEVFPYIGSGATAQKTGGRDS